MNEIAIVGKKKQPGRVLIQPADALQAPLYEFMRKEGKNAGMMPGLVRAFISCRFMQDDVKILPCLPLFSIDRKVQGIRFEESARVGADFAAYFNATIKDHVSAPLSAAETLLLKNLFQCHFHNGIVKEFCHKKRKNRFYVIICERR